MVFVGILYKLNDVGIKKIGQLFIFILYVKIFVLRKFLNDTRRNFKFAGGLTEFLICKSYFFLARSCNSVDCRF